MSLIEKLILLAVVAVIVIAFQLQIADLNASVDHLDSFVEDLEGPPSPTEQQENEAISEAVRQVPEIRAILCEQFPQATACQE
jgi:hypothetical protein